MSASATNYRLFYPDSNTVTALNLYATDGAALTPASIADGSGDPAGWNSKLITLASAAEALFCTPTFQTPASPVSVYLYRDDAGAFRKTLDETVFDSAHPGRPTPSGNNSQWLLYTATDQGAGVRTWTLKTPGSPVAIIKGKGKDATTGEQLYGNTFLFRWTGVLPTLIEVECDVEDLFDASGFNPVPVTNITTYAESSVGLSLVQSQSEILPQDGISHVLQFRMRYTVNGDIGAWVTFGPSVATYEMEPPNPPASLTASLLRDRADAVPDLVQFTWQKAATNPGTSIQIVAYDYLNKKHTVYESNGGETTALIENVSRFVVQDAPPAVARAYRFAIVSGNISSKSDEVFAAAPLHITSKVKAQEEPTPDEVAGTARDVDYATLKAEVFANVLSALGTLPPEAQAISNAAVDRLLLKLKEVIAKGGTVTLTDFGELKAKWTKERLARNPATGAPIIVPSYRSLGFTPSLGFKAGTKAGQVLTDAEAKAAA